jgi:hypothetical protein
VRELEGGREEAGGSVVATFEEGKEKKLRQQ